MSPKRNAPAANRGESAVRGRPIATGHDTATRRQTVVALAVNPRQVRVTCPFCEKPHTHGIGEPGGTLQRLAHCGRGEYRMQIGGAA